ncbi:MAG: glycine cleavage system protein GcvH [Clostridia bacterium]|nr:glycine cleavage system protein GcvH [Clostridia bacterium]
MPTPSRLKFTKEHEWVKVEGSTIVIGLTDYAQRVLGEIVFIDLPTVGAKIAAGGELGTVESVKSVADIYTPVAGTVEKVNDTLEDDPAAVNRAPYESWIAVLRLEDPSDAKALMDGAEYDRFCTKKP